ncbi:glycosyltransferase [Modestobacter sp. VKM Ac-2983]|uniref:glycosyltransferase family 2 protein n=1 Tax=Modestobacter sp. VKM Ac-2983 TaxID=3004137 RepID=UPI0022AB71A2|nr:glycosyltransferase [Modestobacter sp. VKM Ac-2983]MCZ2803690.1 glycosyltransferase [Modestobacter sp. VKM Ac-2983]
MISVVVPAHDEAALIGRGLRRLLADARDGEFDVVVVANGCSDDTAAVARAVGGPVRVVETPRGGKIHALNLGDQHARGFPRLYIDADVEVSTATARAVAEALRRGPALAAGARPRPRGDRSPRLVRWNYEAWTRLPVLNRAYVGSGLYAVSAEGHRRISPFPDIVADDEYVRRSFRESERIGVPEEFDIHLPLSVSAYVRRAVRVRRGNVDLMTTAGNVSPDEAPRGLRPALGLLADPRSWHRVASFIVLNSLVRVAGRFFTGARDTWYRDESVRRAAGPESAG